MTGYNSQRRWLQTNSSSIGPYYGHIYASIRRVTRFAYGNNTMVRLYTKKFLSCHILQSLSFVAVFGCKKKSKNLVKVFNQ